MERLTILINVILFSIILALNAPVHGAEIDFEGLAAGTIVDEVSTGVGVSGPLGGSVQVFGFNPVFGAEVNAAVIFDSACPPTGVSADCSGTDTDLGTPNLVNFGGPGIGIGGEVGSPFQNDTPLGNILIVAENLVDGNNDGLVDDPDDADLAGEFVDFDFSTTKNNGKGTVTVNSVTVMDIEGNELFIGNAIELFVKGGPPSFISIPEQGDNGVLLIDEIGVADVERMRINLNGSAAIASVVVNEELPGVCWITTGGFHNAGIQSGSKICTFGGNVGPNPSGAWQVIDHTTGNNFHTNDVDIVECTEIQKTGPGQPGGKKGLTTNMATFAGTGRLNGVDGFPFTGFVVDAGEPSGKNNNDKDEFSITVTNGGGGVVVFECAGELDGGNVQIHPANPGTLK